MRVVLLKDIKKLGSKYEVKEVADGYARNHLIPQGLAKVADEVALKWAKEQREKIAQKATNDLERVGELASQLEGREVEIVVKVGDQGQLFERVNAQKIASRLNEMGYPIKKEQVVLEEPIEDLGEFEVKINFEHNLEVQITVIVSAEQQ